MTAEEVIELIDPTLAFENALERIATTDSYYLYEISRAGFSDHLQIWIFDNLDQFKAFLPALYFRNLVMEFSDIEEDDYDYQSLFDDYQKLVNTELNLQDLKLKIKALQFDNINYLEFGAINEILAVSEEQFEVCKQELFFDPEETYGIPQGFYRIINRFYQKYKCAPTDQLDHFLEYISSDEISDF